MNIEKFNKLPLIDKLKILEKVNKGEEKLTNKNEVEELFGTLKIKKQ